MAPILQHDSITSFIGRELVCFLWVFFFLVGVFFPPAALHPVINECLLLDPPEKSSMK